MGYITSFLHSQLFVSLPYPKSDFSNQTIIVTGSNSGLGFEAARHFIRLKANKVILAVRTLSKGETAAAEISDSTQTPPSRIEVWQLDLSSHDSVKAFGDRVRTLDRLDAMVENAGILSNIFTLTEGYESHINVNVINTVLLGLLVLPKLRESAKKYGSTGRLVFVGSDLHLVAKFKEQNIPGSLLEALNSKEAADMDDRLAYPQDLNSPFSISGVMIRRSKLNPCMFRYKVSKLLLLYATRGLASLSPVSPDSDVIINYLTPGACDTDLSRDPLSWLVKGIKNILVSLVARSSEAGSRTLVDAARPEIGKETHGAFLMDCIVVP